MSTANPDFIRDLEKVTSDAKDLVATEAQLESATQTALAEREARISEVKALTDTIAGRDAALTILRAEIERLKAAPSRMFVGACPRFPAGEGLKAAQSVIDVWGKGAAVRQFFGTSAVAPRPKDASIVMGSWKVGKISTMTEAWFRKVTANLLPGDGIEIIHEGNSKVALGTVIEGVKITRPVLVALKNHFYELAKKLRPDLIVIHTLTVWEAVPANSTTKGEINAWAEIKADYLGLDFDGIVPKSSNYHDFMDAIGAAAEFVARSSVYTGWCVPEFGTVLAPDDPTGEKRAAWIDTYLSALRETGCKFVMAYEYEPDADTTRYSDAFTDLASALTWRAAVALAA